MNIVSTGDFDIHRRANDLLSQVESRVRTRLERDYPDFMLPPRFVEAANRQREFYYGQLTALLATDETSLLGRTKLEALLKNYEEALATIGKLIDARAYSELAATRGASGRWSQTRTPGRHIMRLLGHLAVRILPVPETIEPVNASALHKSRMSDQQRDSESSTQRE